MTLSQDYKAGGLTAEGAGDEGCHGDGQFEEWHCRHVGGPSGSEDNSSHESRARTTEECTELKESVTLS